MQAKNVAVLTNFHIEHGKFSVVRNSVSANDTYDSVSNLIECFCLSCGVALKFNNISVSLACVSLRP